MRNLHPILLERGSLALSSLGSISDQTLAGALSTSTHGSGVTFSSISTYATFLDIVLPQPGAPVVRVSRSEDQDPDLFHAALCGLGAVGIVVGVGMRAEPVFKLEEEIFTMRFDEFTKRWQEIAESAEHVRCWWFPQVARVKISRLNRTNKVSCQVRRQLGTESDQTRVLGQAVTPGPSAVSSYLQNVVLAKHIHAVALSAARYLPALLPYHAWFMWTFREQPGPVRWREFFAGIWARVSGSKTGGPWPRIEELDQDGKGAVAELPFHPVDPATLPEVRPSDVSSPSFDRTDSNESSSSKLTTPDDMLTPPYTPPTQSPVNEAVVVDRPVSPASDLELPTSIVEEVEAKTAAKQERTPMPWPILEDKPTYRVDLGVKIFNYDCGL